MVNKNEKDTDNKNKKGKRKKIWRISILIVLILGIVGIGTGAGIAYSYIKDTPPINMDKFEYMEPSIILDINGDFYQELQGEEKREIVSIDKIPDIVQKAFISIEDERFEKHKGIDLRGIGQAVLQGIKARNIKTAGGSTITQQLIKLTQLSPDKNFKRKAQEAYLAIQLERNWTKKQILEAYLNKINFAYAHGVQAAAQTYFRKDVDELSISQAAVLAAIPRAPSIYKPYVFEKDEDGVSHMVYEEDGETIVHSPKNRDRALTIIGKLKELGHINEGQYNQAKDELLNNKIGLVSPEVFQMYSFFTDALYDQVLKDIKEEFNYNSEEAISLLINSGLVVHSTVDPKVQSIMDENFKNDKLFPSQSSAAKNASKALSEEKGEEIEYKPEGAMVVIDNKTGNVSGIVGGRDKKTSRSLNRALQSFQPGSSTKPLTVYAPGIDAKKITLASTYDDVPIVASIPGSKNWKPRNSGGGNRGMTTVRKGLTSSLNIIAAQALFDVGVETSMEYGERFGLNMKDATPAALALGGYAEGQTPLAMASAFSSFPSGGIRTEPTFYTKIEDSKGNVILEKKTEKTQVISPQTAYLITDVLKDVVRIGTTNISVPKTDVAGKTGTTDSQMHAWFVGYTPQYTAAVWYGYDQNKLVVNGKTYKLNINIYGGSKPGPASMWERVMRDIHKDLGSQKFPGNPGGLVSAHVDSISGLLPTELSARDPRGSTVISELFINGTVPTEEDNYHVELEVDISTNKIANEFCPPELVQSKVFILKPEDRFPGSVRASNPNFVPKSEAGVIAPSEDDICDKHGPTSLNELEITASKNTIQINEELQLAIKGSSYDGQPVSISDVEFITDSNIVEILNKNTGLIKGKKAGSANITATIKFKYKTLEDGQQVEKEYSKTASIKIKVVEAKEVKEELELKNDIEPISDNLYKITLIPTLKNYTGDFNISLNSNDGLNLPSKKVFDISNGESISFDVEVIGENSLLSVVLKANNQSKKWNFKNFKYVSKDE